MATMTSQQLRDYEARMYGRMQRALPASPPVIDESDLHNQIIDYCNSKGWGYLHGSMAARTHRTLGEPDFVILANGSQLRIVECKSKTGKLSKDQQAFAAQARRNGHVVYVVHNMEEFTRLFV